MARNLVKYPFSIKIDDTQAENLVKEVRGKFFGQQTLGNDYYGYFDMNHMDLQAKNSLAERCTITPLLRDKKQPAGLITSQDESECVMINEEDHLRIQTVSRGISLEEVYKRADSLDDVLSERLSTLTTINMDISHLVPQVWVPGCGPDILCIYLFWSGKNLLSLCPMS